MKKPKIPKEDPQIGQLRDRQIRQLAEIDEDENERLKAAFVTRRGARAFRRTGAPSSSGGSSSGGPANSPRGGRAFDRRAQH